MTRAEAEMRLREFIRFRVARNRAVTVVEITEAVTQAVRDWLAALGAVLTERETPITYEMDGRNLRGRIDVVGRWKDGRRMAVEIDHMPKLRSFRKLEALKAGGWHVAWVRWDAVAVPTDGLVPCIWVHSAATRNTAKRHKKQAPEPRMRLRVVSSK